MNESQKSPLFCKNPTNKLPPPPQKISDPPENLEQTPPPPPVDRILDTRFWKYYLGPTSLRPVMTRRMFSGLMWWAEITVRKDNSVIQTLSLSPQKTMREFNTINKQTSGHRFINMLRFPATSTAIDKVSGGVQTAVVYVPSSQLVKGIQNNHPIAVRSLRRYQLLVSWYRFPKLPSKKRDCFEKMFANNLSCSYFDLAN